MTSPAESDAVPTSSMRSSASALRRLRVELGARSYDILIGPDLLAQDESWVALVAGRQVALVTNQLLATLHAPKLRMLEVGTASDSAGLVMVY
ncbi:MAG: hypothetical protein EBW58_12645, partial [Betaproteobacteria bacterium]|nr:hypothetical protein [Betaproteobacteria bacterium]